MINLIIVCSGDCLFERMILQLWRKTTTALKGQVGDVHTRIMKRNYEQVPEWWFISILVVMVIMALACCEGFDKQLQLPWWGVLFSLVIALVFTLPVGVIQATTNMVILSIVQAEKKGPVCFKRLFHILLLINYKIVLLFLIYILFLDICTTNHKNKK